MAGKVYVTGDTHAYIDMGKLAAKEWPEGKTLSCAGTPSSPWAARAATI